MICIFYARKRDAKMWRRWLIDHEGIKMVQKFDKTGRLPPEGISLRLVAPHGIRKLNHTRSEQFKKQRHASGIKQAGKPRRAYRGHKLPEVRWGYKKAA